jgi:protein-tyrosine phosphatase
MSRPPSRAAPQQLDWAGAFNIRDLGGLPTIDGRTTRYRSLIRADDPARLSDEGWSALEGYGIRTIVDLRDESEVISQRRSTEIRVIRIPLVDLSDTQFWDDHRATETQDLYRALLWRWPSAFAAAVKSVARAAPGGVLVHCVEGRDRTGLLVALLLSSVGVTRAAIEQDYEASEARLRLRYERLLLEAAPSERARLARENVAARSSLGPVLDEIDPATFLLDHGASQADVRLLRARLVARRSAKSRYGHREDRPHRHDR